MNPLYGFLLVVALAIVVCLLFRLVERMLYRYIARTLPKREHIVITERAYKVASDDDFIRQKALADYYLAEMADIDFQQDQERDAND